MSSLRGKDISFEDFKKEILEDYRISQVSRQLSKLGRKEVLTGKAKFGIFGDGKEIAQVAMAKNFRNGDWRSGYYRDQTFMLAADLFTPEEFFAQLYGDTDVDRNPGNAGRSFNNHFATRSLNPDGSWKNLSHMKNSAADLSPTAGQMPRLVGLAYASKLFRHNQFLHAYTNLSDHGNEVAFGMIGDASTSEGHFFETMNAAGVMQIPMVVAVWDDGYGISVPVEEQTVKSDISVALKGFERDSQGDGILIYKARGWDYPGLCLMFHEGIQKARDEHVPVLFHVTEMVQPLGHSTSGSHERYKSKERLEWEKAHDPLLKTREWILAKGIATENELDSLEETARVRAKEAREKAWSDFMS
ncbi:MAG: thiamine pyrophosphate-dependent dehydrogenase E1 component subunit alpha, partial [Bacteroidota bacterium]